VTWIALKHNAIHGCKQEGLGNTTAKDVDEALKCAREKVSR